MMPRGKPDRSPGSGVICVGQIATAHGVRGLVRLRAFTADPEAIADYGPFCDEAGRETVELTIVGRAKGHFLAEVDGIHDREGAMALRGAKLCVPRDRLPETDDDDEFYHVDLIGLSVITVDDRAFGIITSVEDHGAGDVVEIARESGEPAVVVPFTRRCFPVIEIAAGRVVIDPPAGLLDEVGDALDTTAEVGRAHG